MLYLELSGCQGGDFLEDLFSTYISLVLKLQNVVWDLASILSRRKWNKAWVLGDGGVSKLIELEGRRREE